MELKRALYSDTSDAYCSISQRCRPLSLFSPTVLSLSLLFELPHPLCNLNHKIVGASPGTVYDMQGNTLP